MESNVVESFQNILKFATDETFTETEALDIIINITKNILLQYGHPVDVDPEIDEEND